MTAPIIVTALFDADDHALLDGLRRLHFPPERNVLAAHLTLFHHLPPSIVEELGGRLRDETAAPAPIATLAGVMDLGGGTALWVRSAGLEAIRGRLAEAFAALLIPQDAGGWRPHVTIQNKVARGPAVALQAELAGRYDDRPLAISGLASWWYRGGPWERIAAYRFSRAGRSPRS